MLHSSAKKNDKGLISRSFGYNDFMKDGFTAGMLRGTDSSGVFQIDVNGKPYISKLPLPGVYFATDSSATGILNDTDESPITVGHVRAATAGKISTDNAHPFTTKSRKDGSYIMGVHNGSLNYWKFDPMAKDYDVDSEWALNLIAEEGADAFESIEGSFSFVWWDSRHPEALFFARNDQRPMFLLRSSDGRSILGASEAGMLSWLADRSSLNVETDVYTTEPSKMYRVDTSKEFLVIEDLGALPEAWGRSRTNTSVMQPAPLGNPVLKDVNVGDWNEAMRKLKEGPDKLPVALTHDVVDDHYDEWDFSGYMYNEEKMENERMNKLVEGAKKALALGRKRLAANDGVDVENDSEEYGADAWVSPMYQPPTEWYSNEGTTKEERELAFLDGSYGVMVTYQPVAFDDDSAEVVGEILEPGDARNALAYIRGASIIEYTEELKDRMVQAVIVGVANIINGEAEYIVSPLTEEGEKGVLALVA